MKAAALSLLALALIASSAHAQTVSGSNSNATSSTESSSVSIAKGGAANSGSESSVSGVTSSAVTGPSTSSANQTASVDGNAQAITFNESAPLRTQRIVTAPGIGAPGLTTTLSETCMGSRSAGLSLMGGGGTLGGTYTDQDCVIRLDAREVAQTLGDREAARAIMCEKPRVARAYAKVGQPCPGTAGYAAYVAEVNAAAKLAAAPKPTPAPVPAPVLPAATMRPIPNSAPAPYLGERG